MIHCLNYVLLIVSFAIIISTVEDFSTRIVPFTVRANSTEPEEKIVINVVDDNVFEPEKEGFRLVLIVNDSVTPRSQVAFGLGMQVALFRIDDQKDSELHDNLCPHSLLVFSFVENPFQHSHLDLRMPCCFKMTSQVFTP